MTYLQFHLVFLLPPILLLLLVTWRELRAGRVLSGALGGTTRLAWLALGGHLLVALLYTTPWDNYLVASEVWGYGPERVLFTIGYVPVEEYAFFLLQPILTGLFLFFVARRVPSRPASAGSAALRFMGAGFFLALSALGVLALQEESGRYFGLIVIWAGPLLALQWGFGGDLLVARARIVVPGLLIPTLYLWFADRFAIASGIWWISEAQTLGWRPLGLPFEEALFFLVTNLLVGFGLTLVLHPASLPRLRRMKLLLGSWWRAALVLWALSMIPVPLVPEAFSTFAHVSTLLLVLGTLGYALERYGPKAWLLFAVAFLFGWAVEWLGSTTGVPFGRYSYRETALSLLGVPLIVPLGWWAFTLVSLAVARSHKLLLAPLALVAWDLGLDPLMVAQGFWSWQPEGPYYTVPLSNFLGWYLAGLALVYLLMRLEPKLAHEEGLEPRIVYTAQTFLMSVGLATFGMPLAALVTFLAMGAISLRAWQPEARGLLLACR
jgi:lycopene beta-cyclase